MKNIIKKISIFTFLLSSLLIISSCNSLTSKSQDVITIQKNIDLREINPNVEHDQNTIQTAEEAATIYKEDSIYTGFNSINVDGYQIVYGPGGQNILLIYYKGQLISELDGNSVKLYQDNSYLPYINQSAIQFNKKENSIIYTDGNKVFSDFGLNGIDGIYTFKKQKNKSLSALLGDEIIPKQLFYNNQECKMITSDGIACCVVEGKKEAMHLGINGWQKISTNKNMKCDDR